MTLEILCEEFRLADEIKVQKKRSKRKTRRQIKKNEVCCCFCCFSKSIRFIYLRINRQRKSMKNKFLAIINKTKFSFVVEQVVVVHVYVIIVMNDQLVLNHH